MKLFRHIILILTALILASCAVDEFWGGTDYKEGEEVIMTFNPSFVDFEAATKAIGDGTKVNTLLVHVYEGNSDTPNEYTYNIEDAKVQSKVSIPFFYGKEYKVYFFAYKAGEGTAYEIAENGLKGGVTVTYPKETPLNFNSLETLDAFYSVKTVKLSEDEYVEKAVSLTRPFAQVNLTADKAQLLAAKATKVEFTVSAATSYDFVNGSVGQISSYPKNTFSFEATDYFQNNEVISEGTVYLGTTYLFVPSGNSISATVTLYDEAGKVLRESVVEIPLVSNKRTNLVFSGIEPAGPSWDDNEVKVPEVDSDGWIHITRPEQLAAFLLYTTADGAKVCIDNDIDMEETPEDVATNLAKASKSVKSLTFNGNNKTISGLTLSAFFNEATNLTVYDLILSGITVTSESSHVGVLVNTLKGESSFTNVNILNSSATTTNGAAGGMVGYIVRKSETDRSESMHISFSECQVISTSATGKETAGKFVGKFSGYDNGEILTFTGCSTSEASASADNASPYVEGNEGAWLADIDYTTFNSWLGDEAYYRGVVNFGDNRFQLKWDGTKTIEPLLANATYDEGTTAGANRYVVYSAFDLAGLRKKMDNPAAIYFRADIDMNGQGADGKFNVPSNFAQSAHASVDDNNFDPFNYVTTLDGKKSDTENYSIYNMAITQLEKERAAFILYASGTTSHKNINFRNCQTVAVHKDVATDAKAYGAILISNVDATYTMENVHAYDCRVFALQKIGTLGARISGTSTLKNNTVNSCYVENYECNISERFDSGTKEALGMTVRVYADFYPHGEVGGMYGFIQGKSTLINCKVNRTTIYAFGQNDKNATVEGDRTAQIAIAALGYYLVPGRHVSTFIGNIRATGIIEIQNCSVDETSKCTKRWDKHKWREKTGGSWLKPTYKYHEYDYIGQAYYVEFLDSKGSVSVDGTSLTLGNCINGTLQ